MVILMNFISNVAPPILQCICIFIRMWQRQMRMVLGADTRAAIQNCVQSEALTHTQTFIGTHWNGTDIVANGKPACKCKNQAAKAHLVRIMNFPLDWSLQWHPHQSEIEKFGKKLNKFCARIQCSAASRQHSSHPCDSFWKFYLTTNVGIWCAEKGKDG